MTFREQLIGLWTEFNMDDEIDEVLAKYTKEQLDREVDPWELEDFEL